VRTKFADLGMEAVADSPAAFTAIIKSEIPMWQRWLSTLVSSRTEQTKRSLLADSSRWPLAGNDPIAVSKRKELLASSLWLDSRQLHQLAQLFGLVSDKFSEFRGRHWHRFMAWVSKPRPYSGIRKAGTDLPIQPFDNLSASFLGAPIPIQPLIS
jgi:hypothetical protein